MVAHVSETDQDDDGLPIPTFTLKNMDFVYLRLNTLKRHVLNFS